MGLISFLRTFLGGGSVTAPPPSNLTVMAPKPAPCMATKSASRKDGSIVWTAEYDLAMKKLLAPVEEEPVVFVTGPGGVGKSILMREMEKRWKALHPGERIAKLAPTGVAAVNIDGRTIHSFFKFDQHRLGPESGVAHNFRAYCTGRGNELLSPNDIRQFQECRSIGLLLVDEISMVRPDLVDSMDAAMKCLKRNNKPFGRCKTVFFGDLGQLPPIYETEGVRHWFQRNYGVQRPFFFNAHVFENQPKYSPDAWPVHLTKVFRQDDATFIAALQGLRCGEWSDSADAMFSSRYDSRNNTVPPGERTTLFCTNADVAKLNARCLAALPTPQRTFDMIVTGEARRYRESRFKYPRELTVAIGARVMILKNNLPDYHNGTVGIVTDIQDDCISVQEIQSHRTFAIQRETEEFASPNNPEKIIGGYRQFPLRLAWAITVHKSQGQTYDDVYVDVSGNFALGHVYTAFSRVRSLEGLHLLSPDYLPTIPTPPELRAWLTPPPGKTMPPIVDDTKETSQV